MASPPPGTDPRNEWVLLEAYCSEDDDSVEDEPEPESATDLEFLDNSIQEQGNTLSLFRDQENEDSQRQLLQLKRKLLQSPQQEGQDLTELSPRLHAIRISPPKKTPKRRLFELEGDSGVVLSLSMQNETSTSDETRVEDSQVDHSELDTVDRGAVRQGGGEQQGVETLTKELLRSNNVRATLLAKFKGLADASFTELTRQFRSDRTCCADWVVAAFGITEILYESTKTVLAPHCLYMQLRHLAGTEGRVLLMLLQFKAAKNRCTVKKLLQGILGVPELVLLADPPRCRSVAVAVYWYRTGVSAGTYITGETPTWLKQQISISHQNLEVVSFDLASMVQWAYDNNITDECTLAYGYASLADQDSNAAAWLASASQARYLKDCITMVRLYKRAEMQQMSMSSWIHQRTSLVKQEGDWRDICRFLRLQGVNFISFLNDLKAFLKGKPKHNCILIHGPPNTGKSLFCMNLLNFLGGNVLSFANSKSHFWLQPVIDAKIVLIDDATFACWDYMDTYLRNALDGNPICIDRKHRLPVQTKCPPLLVTSNINILTNERWRYLYSRVRCYGFSVDMPLDRNGNPAFALTADSWASFFKRFWTNLELSDQEDEGEDGDSTQAFRCCTRTVDGLVRTR
ncbi:E1 [Trichechus manatus latirostris papillomavirus 4]|uniref:Replication protein E1 n=1 Tax=Trichechus manatus latirostris papillomavirus 4 TaxID=2848317 RepID=A0A0F6RB76_9PAPI|nr:E1 [Trichechus manatus latirostris papillomavirus 4]AKE50904.1 E1 [Trichechus manatus latirostris papillomavirus 4]